ncbi:MULTISPECIES: hypothetical protein [Bacillus cereus group]|nr:MULTISPECIES: hypothetical protein [Bacillus cereus group]MDN4098152.1 hypothetical protein [Bacillus cereus]MDZ4589129.1 hypothetical protein [Bacillus cereus]
MKAMDEGDKKTVILK